MVKRTSARRLTALLTAHSERSSALGCCTAAPCLERLSAGVACPHSLCNHYWQLMHPDERNQVLAHLATLTKLAIRNNALLESIFFSKIVEHAVATGAPTEQVVAEFQGRLAQNQRAALRVFDAMFNTHGLDVLDVAADQLTPEGFPADLIEDILGPERMDDNLRSRARTDRTPPDNAGSEVTNEKGTRGDATATDATDAKGSG